MAFTLPDFNTSVLGWDLGNLPSTQPVADYLTFGQLYCAKEAATVADFTNTAWTNDEIVFEWRFSSLFITTKPANKVGCVFGYIDFLGLTWYYKILAWERKHIGFPNEYVAVFASQCDDAGVSPDAGR